MFIESSDSTLEKLQNFSKRREVLNLHSQAHARAILRGLKALEEEWPSFHDNLDIRMYYAAHYQIWKALQLLDVKQYKEQAKKYLEKGAEALEFLYRDPGSDPAVRGEELFKATLAYYISGHYARSYVLMKETSDTLKNLPGHLLLIAAILKKDLNDARRITLEAFTNNALTDQTIADELEKGTLGGDEALSRILYFSICRAVSFYLEYIKTGDNQILERTFHVVNNSISFAKDCQLVDGWWWSFCLRFLFEEYSKTNLWNQIQPFSDDGYKANIIKRYIRCGLRQIPPITELWPSQVDAIPMINDMDRRHFCLKMPTSAGKTRIAELTILRFLLDTLDNPDKKCAYIAPFRSLAVEIEKTLRRGLGPLGVKVSEIYGGFELTPAENTLIQETQTLVATPEKFDAILRYMPEIEEDIGLIVIDEGHIVDPGQTIDPNERGLRFEFFLHRLLRRYKDKDCRFIFISAVLPNAKEFAEWITGSPDGGLLQSDWRPSRLMLGRLTWYGKTARIDYTHIGRRNFGQDCFVPRFIEARDCKRLPGVGMRRNPFPWNAKEAIALSALLFAQEGTTLVFVPQQRQVEPFGRALLEALKIQKALAQVDGKDFEIPYPREAEDARQRCRQVIEDEIGENSYLIEFFNKGFLIHHAGLPQRVRVAIEDLVRSDGISLIVATTTLAQGVNLPIKTVLVRGLQHGYRIPVSAISFWNICGRAGRAGKENEGQILFYVDRTRSIKQIKRYEKAMDGVLDTLEQTAVISATRLLLQMILEKWRGTHPQVDVAELCIYLANNDYNWVSEESRDKIRRWIDILDEHLLALSEEFDIDPAAPDRLQEILEGSLLFIQLRNDLTAQIRPELAAEIMRSRISYIRSRYPQPNIRKRLYKLGMSLSDCETIESHSEKLYELFNKASLWDEWSEKERFDFLLQISQFVLNLNDIKPKRELPDQWPRILNLWLKGVSIIKMVEDKELQSSTSDPTELCLFLEDICGYRLPWGVNSILSYLTMFADELGESLPLICSYFSGMFKYGVNHPIAVCILPYLDRTRVLALIAANICPYSIEHPEEIVIWFRNLTEKDLTDKGLDKDVAKRIVNVRDSFLSFGLERRSQGRSDAIKVILRQGETVREFNIGDRILIVPRPKHSERHFQIFTLDGKNLGVFRRRNLVPQWWAELHLVDSVITDIQKLNDGRYSLSIRLEEV